LVVGRGPELVQAENFTAALRIQVDAGGRSEQTWEKIHAGESLFPRSGSTSGICLTAGRPPIHRISFIDEKGGASGETNSYRQESVSPL
jgi:hypothetical protein